MGKFRGRFAILLISIAANASVESNSFIDSRNSPVIRVRVLKNRHSISLGGFDLSFHAMGRGRNSDRLSHWEVRCDLSGLHLRRLDPKPSSWESWSSPIRVESQTRILRVDGRPYRESMQIRLKGGTCEAINSIDVEDYLIGLLNAEFSSKWREASVDAQAIAARSYAHWKMREAKQRGVSFDLEATTEDQFYDGFLKEDALASRSVARTRGMILESKSNPEKPFEAYYHSTCGGSTTTAASVWGTNRRGKIPVRVKCDACLNSPRFQWKAELDRLEAARALRKEWKMPGEFLLAGLDVQSLDPSGRVRNLKAHWVTLDGRVEDRFLSGVEFRNEFGPTRIRSAAFHISGRAGPGSVYTYFIEGRGNGHGVGMCQWGAKTLGESGFSAQEILSKYYPDAVVRKRW